jgi:predicted nuclease of predicted toxin-antitoxin system
VKLVIDMNLGKDWIDCLQAGGHDAVHRSAVGNPADDDADIMRWASANGHVVLTAELDFGTLLATSKAAWPSVVQLRAPNTPPSYAGSLVLKALAEADYEVETGALVTVSTDRHRVRPLPINSAD